MFISGWSFISTTRHTPKMEHCFVAGVMSIKPVTILNPRISASEFFTTKILPSSWLEWTGASCKGKEGKTVH